MISYQTESGSVWEHDPKAGTIRRATAVEGHPYVGHLSDGEPHKATVVFRGIGHSLLIVHDDGVTTSGPVTVVNADTLAEFPEQA